MIQLPLIPPDCDWRKPSLAELPSWKGAQRVAFDVETRDEHLPDLGPGVRRGAYIVGLSFAIEDGPSFYLPIRHEEGQDNLPVDAVLAYFREQAASFDGYLVGTNLGYDLDFAAEEDIMFSAVKRFRDIQIAEPLLDESRFSYSLDTLAKEYLGEGKNIQLMKEAAVSYGMRTKKGARKDELYKWIWRIPGRYAAAYGIADVEQPLAIIGRQERRLEADDLWNVYELESRLLPVVTAMRRRGVRIDFQRLEEIEHWTIAEESKCLSYVKKETGVGIAVGEVWQSELLARALHAIGLNTNTTAAGADSVDKDLLASLDHPVAKAMARARRVNKIRTTFAASIRRYQTNGRIHCTYNQLRREKDDGELGGAKYGRLSCIDPNMQQQPARPNKEADGEDDIPRMWRSIYLPEEGAEFAALDYSQQEPRMAVHYGCVARQQIGDVAWQAAMDAAEKYRTDPKTDNHQMMADMANIPRKDAKEIYLGLSYGMGGAKLCRKLGLPTAFWTYDRMNRQKVLVESSRGEILMLHGGRSWEGAGLEGQALLDRFDSKVSFIKKLAKSCESMAQRRGYVRTVLGRLCRFPKKLEGGYDWCHKAFSRVIQGSSADQTKEATIQLYEAGHYVQLQVHDELDGSVKDKREAEAMAEIMCNCVPLKCVSKVDIGIGKNWGEAM